MDKDAKREKVVWKGEPTTPKKTEKGYGCPGCTGRLKTLAMLQGHIDRLHPNEPDTSGKKVTTPVKSPGRGKRPASPEKSQSTPRKRRRHGKSKSEVMKGGEEAEKTDGAGGDRVEEEVVDEWNFFPEAIPESPSPKKVDEVPTQIEVEKKKEGRGRRRGRKAGKVAMEVDEAEVEVQGGQQPMDGTGDAATGAATNGREVIELDVYTNLVLEECAFLVTEPFRIPICKLCHTIVAGGGMQAHAQKHGKGKEYSDRKWREAIKEAKIHENITGVYDAIAGSVTTGLPFQDTIEGMICSCGEFYGQASSAEKHVCLGGVMRTAKLQTIGGSRSGRWLEVVPVETSVEDLEMEDAELRVMLDEFSKMPNITAAPDIRQTHPFLLQSGWKVILEAMSDRDVKTFRELSTANPNIKKALMGLVEDLKPMITPNTVFAREALNRPKNEANVRPWAAGNLETTSATYAGYMASALTYLFATASLPADQRFYDLTGDQDRAIAATRFPAKADAPTEEEIENLKSDLLAVGQSLIRTPIDGQNFLRAFLPAYTAHWSFDFGPRLKIWNAITPHISGLEWWSRLFIYFFCYEEAKKEGALSMKKIAEAEAKEYLSADEETPFGVLSKQQSMASSASMSEEKPAIISTSPFDPEAFSFDGYPMTYDAFVNMVRGASRRSQAKFQAMWAFLRLEPEDLWRGGHLVDRPRETAVNYSFAQAPENVEFRAHGRRTGTKAVKLGKLGYKMKSGIVWDLKRCKEFLKLYKEWLVSFAAAIYLGAGQPPRGTELFAALSCNLPGRMRGYLSINGLLALVLSYGKMSIPMLSDLQIIRMLPEVLTEQGENAAATIVDLVLKANKALGRDKDVLNRVQSHVFVVDGEVLDTSHLTEELKSLSGEYLGVELGIADMRHLAIHVGRRMVLPLLGKSLTKEHIALFDLQAGHTSETSIHNYAIKENLMDDDAISRAGGFRWLSLLQHHVFGLTLEKMMAPDREPMLTASRMNLLPPEEEIAEARQTLAGAIALPGTVLVDPQFTWELRKTQQCMQHFGSLLETDRQERTLYAPRIVGAEQAPLQILPSEGLTVAMKAIHRSKNGPARWRSPEQSQGAQLVASGQRNVMVVLPTGGGKSTIIQAPLIDAVRRGLRGTVFVISPLKSLADDHVAKAQALNIVCVKWDGRPPDEDPQMLVCLPEQTKGALLAYARRLMHKDPPGILYIAVDEPHYLMGNADWRTEMVNVVQFLRVGAPVVLLTATAPYGLTHRFQQWFLLNDLIEVRGMTGRKNLRYVVLKPPVRNDSEPTGLYFKSLIERATEKYDTGEGRIIVFFQSRTELQLTCDVVKGMLKYEGPMSSKERAAELKKWGSKRRIIGATSALGTGVDLADVTMTIHMGTTSIMDFDQESGRAGRKGEAATCVLYTFRKPLPLADDFKGVQALEAIYNDPKMCYRRPRGAVMDGRGETCKELGPEWAMCNRCEKEDEELEKKASVIVGPAVFAPAASKSADEIATEKARKIRSPGGPSVFDRVQPPASKSSSAGGSGARPMSLAESFHPRNQARLSASGGSGSGSSTKKSSTRPSQSSSGISHSTSTGVTTTEAESTASSGKRTMLDERLGVLVPRALPGRAVVRSIERSAEMSVPTEEELVALVRRVRGRCVYCAFLGRPLHEVEELPNDKYPCSRRLRETKKITWSAYTEWKGDIQVQHGDWPSLPACAICWLPRCGTVFHPYGQKGACCWNLDVLPWMVFVAGMLPHTAGGLRQMMETEFGSMEELGKVMQWMVGPRGKSLWYKIVRQLAQWALQEEEEEEEEE